LIAPAEARLWVALDLHELSIAAAPLPPAGGRPDVVAIETTEKAIRRFIDRLARTLRKTALLLLPWVK